MSRRHKKKPAPATHPLPYRKPGKQSLLRLLPVLLCLMPAVFFFAFGKFLEFNQPGPFDSGAYVYSAKHLLEGARLGVDEIPSAEPGTLLVNVIGVYCFGFSDTGPKVVQMILQFGALAAMFIASRKLFGRTAAVLSVTMAALTLSAPHIAKVGNVKEQYMIAFMVMAASFWIFYELTEKKRWLLLTGAALIWPYYFKATGLTVDIAFSLYFLGRAVLTKISFRQFQRELLLLVGGALIGILPLPAFFLWQRQPGILPDSLPFLILKSIVVLDVLGIGIFYFRKIHLVTFLRSWSRQVRLRFRIAGLALICLALAVSCLIIYIGSREDQVSYLDNLRSYLGNLFFVRILSSAMMRLVHAYRVFLQASGTASAYISGSRQVYSLSKQAPVVLRYYASLSLVVAAALVSIAAGFVVTIQKKLMKKMPLRPQDRLAWLLIFWWVLDMAFVWISPRSYEQYYLPLCASGAMLGGYAVWLFAGRLEQSPFKFPYLAGSAAALGVMAWMAWPIVFGLKKSPFSGQPYVSRTGRPERRRGYMQTLEQVRGEEGAWEKIGRTIHQRTTENDRIYVWGWYPGIYVQAQRMAPVPKAFEGDMHIQDPRMLASEIQMLVGRFQKNPPAFIVDTRKQHFPWDRPPLELWPNLQKESPLSNKQGYLLNQPQAIEVYEKGYSDFLGGQVGPEEVRRFEAIKPLRDYVMAHYRIVPELSWPRSPHVLFERK